MPLNGLPRAMALSMGRFRHLQRKQAEAFAAPLSPTTAHSQVLALMRGLSRYRWRYSYRQWQLGPVFAILKI